MGGHISCYGWAWVDADDYGLGMGTNSKENVGLWCVGTAFGHFLWGSHNFMVTALGSCVKSPLARVGLGTWDPM